MNKETFGLLIRNLLEHSIKELKASCSLFFARANSLFLQEFQTTFHPGNLLMSFH